MGHKQNEKTIHKTPKIGIYETFEETTVPYKVFEYGEEEIIREAICKITEYHTTFWKSKKI